ncbi:MAG: Rrf2 family transcriptional regulator [Alphaproteobacteria bacterium]
MQLTRYTDYSLRLMMYVALHPEKCVTIKEVADKFVVPQNHLMKIARNLGQYNYIRATRGKGGGLRLARPAEAINLRDLVWDMEPSLEIFDCQKPHCPIAGDCIFKKAIMEARTAFFAALENYNLAQLVANKTGLMARLTS